MKVNENRLSYGVAPASVLLTASRPGWLQRWGDFAASMHFGDLPEAVIARARLALLDSIGVIAAGMQEPEVAALAKRLAKNGDGNRSIPIIGSDLSALPAIAALLHGIAGTTLELDEGNQYARGHPAIHVMPATFSHALAGGKSGSEFLLAFVLGYEIASRIGIASKLNVAMHPHGTWGVVGAALAAARLDGATAEEIVEAVNISSSFGLSTSRRTMLEGATVRNSYAGLANQLGLLAWDMTLSGFKGERDGVGSVYGSIIAADFRTGEMDAEIGSRWEIARNYFKRHAACRYAHAALDALFDMIRQAGGKIDPDRIAAIDVETYVWAAQLDGQEPQTMLAAKFSLPFALATVIVNGEASVEAFRDQARADEKTRDLARRVTVRENTAYTAMLPGLRPARVTVVLDDGRKLSAEATVNKGDTEDPYSSEDVHAKFRELTIPLWGQERAEAIVDAVATIDSAQTLEGLRHLVAIRP